jgi:nanoRNase/pAp phosphatase (c-di-AMP/oligoRNAs hydrolase)
VLKAHRGGVLVDQVFAAFLGSMPREDFIPYVADFFLQLEDVKWTVIAGIVNDSLVVSVRNLGYTKNAGEFVRKVFADIGSAGGHRAMAKAVVPLRAFREKFGDVPSEDMTAKLQAFAHEFLAHETAAPPKREAAGIKN